MQNASLAIDQLKNLTGSKLALVCKGLIIIGACCNVQIVFPSLSGRAPIPTHTQPVPRALPRTEPNITSNSSDPTRVPTARLATAANFGFAA